MVDQNVLTVFIALTAVAVLIQCGILLGLCFMSFKLTRQADRAAEVARTFLGPIQHTAEHLQVLAARMTEVGAVVHSQLRQFEQWRRGAR